MKQLEDRKQHILTLFKARELLTMLVLILSLIITFNLWKIAERNAQQTLQTTFDFRVRESNERIQQRIEVYEQILRSGVGLFNASTHVTRRDFKIFFESMGLNQRYPGIHGFGFAQIVPPEEKDSHIAAVRREGFPDYMISPPGKRDIYTSIVYLEPFEGTNLRAFGFDMYSEPARQAAMVHARDTGGTGVTGKVRLIQEVGRNVQSGFLMYLPVYRTNMPHHTLMERRENLLGWVYAPFRMNDFMAGIHGEQTGDLDIEIYDDMKVVDEKKMYDIDPRVAAINAARALRSIDHIQVGNRTWTIVTSALPAFQEKMFSDRPRLILQAGISISLLATLLIWLFLDDRARALQAADQAMQLALYDALTGLPNRKLLEERLRLALAHARRSHGHAALLFIDLDKFKPVNDNYGHAYGDLLLKEVANRLQSCMRESDTASRLGGDEFVALLSDIDGRQAVLLVATKILNQLTLPYDISGHMFEISASIGAALYPEDGSDGKALIKSADLAMYDAKNAGRSNVKFARIREVTVL